VVEFKTWRQPRDVHHIGDTQYIGAVTHRWVHAARENMTWMRIAEGALKTPELVFQHRFRHTFDGMPLEARRLSRRKRLNLLRCGCDAAMRRSSMSCRPPALQIEPSSLCPLRCPLCPSGTGQMKRKPGLMSMTTFERILSVFGEDLVTAVFYCWGEPFSNPLLPDMIAMSTQRGIATVTSTNGQFIQTADEAERVVTSGLQALVIAVDGATQDVYERYRVGGDLARVKNCVKRLASAKSSSASPTPFLNVRMVVTNENEHQIGDVRGLAADLGADMFSIKTVGRLTGECDFGRFDHASDQYRREPDPSAPPVHCPFPFRQPTVFHDGTVVGCEFDSSPDMPLGNVATDDAESIWNGAAAIALRKKILHPVGRPAFCGLCPYRGVPGSTTVLKCEPIGRN